MKILVTGFDPFGGELINPAIETVKKLPDEIAGAKIIKLEIPTVCHKSLRIIDEAIAEMRNPSGPALTGRSMIRMWFCRLDRRAEDLTLPWSAWGSTWMTAGFRIMKETRLWMSRWLRTDRQLIL